MIAGPLERIASALESISVTLTGIEAELAGIRAQMPGSPESQAEARAVRDAAARWLPKDRP